MPGGKDPGPSIKNPDVYEALRKKGYSKQKAAAISNSKRHDASASRIEQLSNAVSSIASYVFSDEFAAIRAARRGVRSATLKLKGQP